MSNGMKIEPQARKFRIGNKGAWPFKTLQDFTTEATNKKGNVIELDSVQVGQEFTATIMKEDQQVTRIA